MLKKFHMWDDKPPILYRDGTSDAAIIQANMIDRNEYIFPNAFKPEIIFDIGGNIGVIAVLLAHTYPDAVIHTFEPIKSNYEILLKNIEHYPNVKPHMFGLSDSDHPLDIWPSEDPVNHGGFSQEIKSKFDPIRCEMKASWWAVEEYGCPDMIKIDVEGAEHSIFQGLPDWAFKRIKWIAGELHGVNDYKVLHHLQTDFKIRVARNFEDVVYHFHALNRNWTPASVQEK